MRCTSSTPGGRPSRLAAVGRAGRIQMFSEPAGVCAQAIEQWARAASAVGPGQAVMIARDNDTRDTLNRAARELRRELGTLGEECSYDELELAVGDRVICRRNDRELDVDNGMRGTVRHLDGERVVIDSDSGLVRELSGAYISEHLEHAYALTGHGTQGGTVETATVVASPHDLTAGWSYTALSRARGHTRLLIYEDRHTEERNEFAPTDQTQATGKEHLAGPVNPAHATTRRPPRRARRTRRAATTLWAQQALGKRPDDPRLRKEWDHGVSQVAHYRLQYDISNSDEPLGAPPAQREQRRDWQRALVKRSIAARAGSGASWTSTTTSASRLARDRLSSASRQGAPPSPPGGNSSNSRSRTPILL